MKTFQIPLLFGALFDWYEVIYQISTIIKVTAKNENSLLTLKFIIRTEIAIKWKLCDHSKTGDDYKFSEILAPLFVIQSILDKIGFIYIIYKQSFL